MLVKKYSKVKPTCKVTFTVTQEAVKGAKRVNILGDFNDWNPGLAIPMKLSGEEFKATLELPVGRDYQFRYRADNGLWENDSSADAYIDAPYDNIRNSVVSLDKSETVPVKATLATKESKKSTSKEGENNTSKANKKSSSKVDKERTSKIGKKNSSKTSKKSLSKKKADDLRKIEGIGPKITGLLTKVGIKTFADLSTTKKSTLKNMLRDAGSRYKMHDPSTWPKQAKLAAKGKWKKLVTFQSELRGGKKK